MQVELISTTFRITQEQADFIKAESLSGTVLVQAMINECIANPQFYEAVKKRGIAIRSSKRGISRKIVIDGISYTKKELSAMLKSVKSSQS
jgi:hypothetical protein